VELYQLRYFVEAARQRSFTQAAKRLNLATPALSVQMQKLEAELGVALFVRGQRQSVLTPAGEILFEKAQALLAMADSVKQSVTEVTELRAGRLAVAFVPALGAYWLPEVFHEFRREYPCVKLALEEDNSLGVAARVEDSSVELGFLELPLNDQAFEIEKVWEEPVLAMLPQDHVLAKRPSLSLRELESEAFVVQRDGSRQQTLEACRRAGFEPRIACECNEKETAIALVQAGLGVMLVPKLAAAPPRQGLVVVPVVEPKLVRQFGLISRRGRELSVAAKAFIELVQKIPFPAAASPARPASSPSAATVAAVESRPSGPPAPARSPEALLTPLRFLERSARVYAAKTAVRHGQQSYSYEQFACRVRRLASALRRAGLEPGDRVAFLCANVPPMLEAHFGVPLAGGVLVPINVRLTAGEIARILDHSDARFFFVDSQFAAVARPLRNHLEQPLKIIDIPETARSRPVGDIHYEDFLATGSTQPLGWPLRSEDDLISLNYTSGTTGKPKGVMISHRAAYLNALGSIVELGLDAASTVLWTLPMFHCNGWGLTWAATAVGATHLCLRKLDEATVWRLITTEKVSHLCGAPTLLAHLLQCPGRPAALQQPLTIFVGGAPPSAALIEQWEALGARVLHGYGLTETCGAYTICEPQPEWSSLPPAQRAKKLRRQGVPFVIGETLRVVDEQLRDVPADGQTLGEVIMRGATVTTGYYKEPEATALDFRDGWFHTGDLAVVHPDGYIELRDRGRDIIIRDGEHLSALEIEQTLAEHPAVAEVAVIGIPDARHGEVPKAFVVPRPGFRTRPATLIEFCRVRLAAFKCPSQVEFLDALPRTASGKVQKFVLREKEWAGRETRIHGA
jgi:fatty-acyl-CoA synthase